jgi:hypothetical protein
MAGRRVFFSFHYKEDVWRASNVRKAGEFDARAAAGWADASLWEATKKRGDAAIQRLIDDGLDGTSVTAVLIGSHTAQRQWVTYEIEKSIERGNGLMGVHIHNMKDQYKNKGARGAVPKALTDGGYPVYNWDSSSFGRWVELAAIGAGKPCLRHQAKGCWRCKFLLRYW